MENGGRKARDREGKGEESGKSAFIKRDETQKINAQSIREKSCGKIEARGGGLQNRQDGIQFAHAAVVRYGSPRGKMKNETIHERRV